MKNYSMTIGTFLKDKEGVLNGQLHMLGLETTPVIFEAKTSANQTLYHNIIAFPLLDSYKIGTAFEKKKGDLTYYSVTLESPIFPAPVHAALFEDKNTGKFRLVWERPEPSFLEARLEQPRQFVGAGAPHNGALIILSSETLPELDTIPEVIFKNGSVPAIHIRWFGYGVHNHLHIQDLID